MFPNESCIDRQSCSCGASEPEVVASYIVCEACGGEGREPMTEEPRLAAPPMTDEQIRIWINACNHEPARQVLRTYLIMKQGGFDVDYGSNVRRQNLAIRSILKRCKTVLGNMALENEGTWRTWALWQNRWPTHHEPLRADAKALLPEIDHALKTCG